MVAIDDKWIQRRGRTTARAGATSCSTQYTYSRSNSTSASSAFSVVKNRHGFRFHCGFSAEKWDGLVEAKNSAGQVIAQYTYNAQGYLVSESYPVGGTGVPAGQINYPGAMAQPHFISAGFRGDKDDRDIFHSVDPLNIYYDSQWSRRAGISARVFWAEDGLQQLIETRTNGTANSNVTSQMVWSAAYPGAAAHTRDSGTGFRAVDTANNFGSTPNTLNINAPVLQDSYAGGVIQPNSRLYFTQDANWDPGAAAHTRSWSAEACPGHAGRFRAVEVECANELSRSASALNTTSVVGFVGGTWQVVQRYVYSPYGTLTILNANFTAAPTDTVPMVNNLYQGMALDPMTGLYYERARWYSPSLGTWVSQDSASYINGADTYQFVMGDPVGVVDPSGLYTGLPPGGIIDVKAVAKVFTPLYTYGPSVAEFKTKVVFSYNPGQILPTVVGDTHAVSALGGWGGNVAGATPVVGPIPVTIDGHKGYKVTWRPFIERQPGFLAKLGVAAETGLEVGGVTAFFGGLPGFVGGFVFGFAESVVTGDINTSVQSPGYTIRLSGSWFVWQSCKTKSV